MKRGRNAGISHDAKDISDTGKIDEEDTEIRNHQRPRTSRAALSDGRSAGINNEPIGGGAASGGRSNASGGISNDVSSSTSRDDGTSAANSLLLRQAQFGHTMPFPPTGGEIGIGGAGRGANPNLASNDNRPFLFNSGGFQDARMPMTNQQRQDFAGGQSSSSAPSGPDPRVVVGYDPNGMPIMVPASVALSLMSMNMPNHGAPGVPMPPSAVPPHSQSMLYPQLLARAQQQQHHQQQRQLMGGREILGTKSSEGSVAGHSSSRSSLDNSDHQANPFKSSVGDNMGMMGASAQGFPLGVRPSNLPQPLPGSRPMLGGTDAPLFARGGGAAPEATGWPGLNALVGPDSHQFPVPFAQSQPGNGHEGNSFGGAGQQQPPSGAPRSFILYMTCDDDSLSDYQCLVRKQIEVFESQTEDVESNAQGRNKPLVMKQVGIRCRHCASLPPRHRARGSTYYPAKLTGLYQAAQNMASNHLCGYCTTIPDALKQELKTLRDRKSPAGGGKQYWADGVRVLGVYENEDGLRFSDE